MTDVQYSIFGSQDLNKRGSRLLTNLLGPRTGLDASYAVGTSVRLSGSAALSLMNGRTHQDDTESFNGLVFTNTGAARNHMAVGIDLATQLAWSPSDSVQVWLALDFSQFINGQSAQTFAAGPGATAASDEHRNVGFLGPSVGLLWRIPHVPERRKKNTWYH